MDIVLQDIKVMLSQASQSLFSIRNLEIKQGEHLLIKGESGKGKTTLLHLIAGLFSPSQGLVKIGQTELTQLNDEEKSRFRKLHMGIVFQKLNLIDYLTPRENVELALDPNHDQKTLATASLKTVGLALSENKKTSFLSMGEQQRVAVARVLAKKPNIILADEPTSSLDEKNALQITQLLIDSAKNKTLIMVSHDHRIEKFFPTIKTFEQVIS